MAWSPRSSLTPFPSHDHTLLRWSGAAVETIVAARQHWAPQPPDDLTANLTVVAQSGQLLEAVLFGASLRDEAPTRRLLMDFCGVIGESPVVDVCGGVPYSHLKNSFEYLDGREGVVSGVRIRSEFFARPMRPARIKELLSTLLHIEGTGRRQFTFTALASAIPETPTALVQRRELLMLEHCSSEPGDWEERSWQIAHADGWVGSRLPELPGPSPGGFGRRVPRA